MQFQHIFFWPLPTSKHPRQCQLDRNSSGGIDWVCVCVCLESGRLGLRPSSHWHICVDKNIFTHLFLWMLWRLSRRRGVVVVVHRGQSSLRDRYVCCWTAPKADPLESLKHSSLLIVRQDVWGRHSLYPSSVGASGPGRLAPWIYNPKGMLCFYLTCLRCSILLFVKHRISSYFWQTTLAKRCRERLMVEWGSVPFIGLRYGAIFVHYKDHSGAILNLNIP